MKIIYIYTSLTTIGGADRIITEKINYLSDVLGHNVYIITDSQQNKPYFFPLSPKAHHIDLGINFNQQYKYTIIRRYFCYKQLMIKYKKILAHEIKKINPDIIITTCGRDLDFLPFLNTSAKLVGESHSTLKNLRNFHLMEEKGFPYSLIAKIWRKKMANNIKKLNAFVVLTHNDSLLWRKIRNSYVIPNSLSFACETISTCENKKIIAVGRLSEEKGFDKLIKAWSLVALKHKDWSIELYGEGEKYNELQTLIKKYNLTNSFIIIKPTKNIIEKYINSSFCVMSSRYEGFGMVLIEAMECGIPCISFNCPNGPKEIIEHNKNGVLVEDGNITAMANAIDWMITHKNDRKNMGKYAKESVRKYSQSIIMKMWENLFYKLIKEGTNNLE